MQWFHYPIIYAIQCFADHAMVFRAMSLPIITGKITMMDNVYETECKSEDQNDKGQGILNLIFGNSKLHC